MHNVDPSNYLYLVKQMHSVVVISDQISPRLQYICELIFGSYLDIPFRVSSARTSLKDEIPIYYGLKGKLPSGITIYREGLLEEKDVDRIDFPVGSFRDLPCFFMTEEKQFTIPFDLFSMSFLLLSRYEEYQTTAHDKFGRYKSEDSLAVKHDFIHLPLVDLWVKEFALIINQQYDTGFSLSGSYKTEITIDIDLPYAFRYKGWKKYGGIIRDIISLNTNTLVSRIAYYLHKKDPFDTYDYLRSVSLERNLKPVFFILNNYERPLDENHLSGSKHLGQIISSLSLWADIGIHPSYSASTDTERVKNEMEFIQQFTDDRITRSRQHYLVLNLPDTYNTLLECDITDDYTMGYPDIMGFRASTARPYKWYDISQECTTELTIHPCITMDATMRYYLKLSPDEALEQCRELNNIIRSVNGSFSFIWHNSSLSQAYGWKPWKIVFKELVSL